MPAKQKVHIESRFPAVKKAAYETVQLARELALNAGEETAHRRVEQLNDTRGYNLPEDEIGQEHIGFQSGKIYIGGQDEFWWRFFEWGTRYIVAFPLIRPASTRMRKVFLGTMEGQLDGFIRRRARV